MQNPQVRKNIIGALIFILGVIVTISITKFSDKIYPNDPVIIKQVTDTIKIVHDYNIPDKIDNDTIKRELEKKLKNLELLNNYDKQIKVRISQIESQNDISPNLIVSPNVNRSSQQGFTYESSSPYFTSDCPKLNSVYIDLKLNFFQPEILKEIAFLRVNIYKFDKQTYKEARSFILEDYYEPKKNNFIRINNDLEIGKYEIIYGFMFKKALKTKYPGFYFKKCVVYKR